MGCYVGCVSTAPPPSPVPPPPSVIVYSGDSIVETGAAMHQPYPLEKKKIHNVHTVTQIHIATQCNTHERMYKYPTPPPPPPAGCWSLFGRGICVGILRYPR